MKKVKEILDHDKKWEKLYYLTEWKSFLSCENNWISERNLENAQNTIKQYYKRQRNVVAISRTKKSKLTMIKENLFETKKNSVWHAEYTYARRMRIEVIAKSKKNKKSQS